MSYLHQIQGSHLARDVKYRDDQAPPLGGKIVDNRPLGEEMASKLVNTGRPVPPLDGEKAAVSRGHPNGREKAAVSQGRPLGREKAAVSQGRPLGGEKAAVSRGHLLGRE